MTTLAHRLSFRTVKNLGVAALLAIFLSVIVFSYLTTGRALDALNRVVQQLLAAQETVLRVNDHLRAANQSFTIYVRRDRIANETLLERFDLLESRMRNLESLTQRGGTGTSLVNKARTAFLYYLDEAIVDPAADSATAYLEQIDSILAALSEQLQGYSASGQATPEAESLEKLIVEINRILGATDVDFYRYVDRERISVEDIEIPVRKASEILHLPEPILAGMPAGTVTAHFDLARTLARYRAALYELAEEDRVSGEATYPNFEQKVSEAAGAAEIALLALNQMMSRQILDHQSQLIGIEEQQQRVLLLLGLSGVILAVGVSIALGRALSVRLGSLVDGTKQVGKGVQGYRFEVGANDEIGLLARAFNDMLVELEEKEAALKRHISNIDAAHRLVQEAKESLERQIFERTRELRDALDQAEVANRTKDEFLAKVSHEMRTPLNGVLGMAEILLRSKLDQHQRHLARSLHESGDGLLRIINDILDFSRMKSGRLELMKTIFDPVETIDLTVDIVARGAQAKGLEFVYYLPPDFPRAIEGDPGRVRQVLLNLLDNAVKFTERGEVSLYGKMEREANQDAVLRFEVCDTGTGIPEQAQGRIFEAFTQADESTTRRFTGTGLGLTIAKQLVEAMNGEIGFSSPTPPGTRFWFTLPLGKYQDSAVHHSTGDLPGRRILIAESNPACRAVLARLVDEFGCESDVVDSGGAALTRLRAMDLSTPYDAALVDTSLLDVSGLELARTFHREATTLPIPLILLTTPDPEDRLESGSIWIAGTVEKPVRREALWRILRSVIDTPLETGAAQPAAEAPKVLQSLRVLVAEDNPVSQEVMRHILEGLGCQVEVASDGRQALDAFARTPFNVVLLDCQMPEVDGYQVATEIRQREGARRHTPLLALTASAMETDRQHCLAVGMDDYLVKPVNERMLLQALSRWCRSSRAR